MITTILLTIYIIVAVLIYAFFAGYASGLIKTTEGKEVKATKKMKFILNIIGFYLIIAVIWPVSLMLLYGKMEAEKAQNLIKKQEENDERWRVGAVQLANMTQKAGENEAKRFLDKHS